MFTHAALLWEHQQEIASISHAKKKTVPTVIDGATHPPPARGSCIQGVRNLAENSSGNRGPLGSSLSKYGERGTWYL